MKAFAAHGDFFASAAVAPQGASRWHLNQIYCECEAFTVKPRRVCRPQAAKKLESFSAGACTWQKILRVSAMTAFRLRLDCIGQHRTNASAAGWRVFSPIRAVWKTGNTPRIPLFSKLSAEEKSLATGSCRIVRCCLKATPLRWGVRASADFLPQSCSTKNGKYVQFSAFFILSLVSKHWPNLLAPLCGAALKKTTPQRGVEGLCGSMPVIPTEECAEAHPLSERWRRLPPLSFPRDCRTPRSHRPRELYEQRLQECRIRYRQP